MTTHESSVRHLEGILVADFSRVLAGPLCTMMLAEAGARVVKIEEPRGDETRRWGPPFLGEVAGYFLSANRGKESIVLDLKSDKGLEAARRLIARADVVVENFKAPHRERFGLAPASVHEINPRAILCSIGGFDSDGPDASQPGYDLLAQAAGGLMSITGVPDGDPMKAGVALSDVLTAHHAHGAILSALLGRQRTGRGEAIEVSLVGSTVYSLANVVQGHLITGERPKRYGNEHPSIVPYQMFHASDRPFVLAAASDAQFVTLCRDVIERSDLLADKRYRTNALRVQYRESLIETLEWIFAGDDADHWVAAARGVGLPAARVDHLDEIVRRNPQLVGELEHESAGPYLAVRSPLRRNGARVPLGTTPPELGADTDALLRELGLPDDSALPD
jgi:crotonobetainyl-CoA:carnitine CoA-transferase CaiB-like acyl-CoA transferase